MLLDASAATAKSLSYKSIYISVVKRKLKMAESNGGGNGGKRFHQMDVMEIASKGSFGAC